MKFLAGVLVGLILSGVPAFLTLALFAGAGWGERQDRERRKVASAKKDKGKLLWMRHQKTGGG